MVCFLFSIGVYMRVQTWSYKGLHRCDTPVSFLSRWVYIPCIYWTVLLSIISLDYVPCVLYYCGSRFLYAIHSLLVADRAQNQNDTCMRCACFRLPSPASIHLERLILTEHKQTHFRYDSLSYVQDLPLRFLSPYLSLSPIPKKPRQAQSMRVLSPWIENYVMTIGAYSMQLYMYF